MLATRSSDLVRTVLQLLILGILIATSFWIIRPFLVPFTWAAMIVVATWPVLLQAQAGSVVDALLAVAVMTITLLLFLVVPLYFVITTDRRERRPARGVVEDRRRRWPAAAA